MLQLFWAIIIVSIRTRQIAGAGLSSIFFSEFDRRSLNFSRASVTSMAVAITRLVRPKSSIARWARRCLSASAASGANSHTPPYNNSSAINLKPQLSRKGQEENRNIHWVFLGCPGVGKGTYASRLSTLIGVPHIATGDLVREELASSGPLSDQVSSRPFSVYFCGKI